MEPAETSRAGFPQQPSLLSDSHLSALRKRGLEEETIAEAGLYSVRAEQATELLGFPISSPGLVLPYLDPDTIEVVLERFRPDNGKPAKYLSPKGVTNHLYLPPDCVDWLRDPSVPIGITEGEFKTLWAYQVGLPYVGLSGVTCWRGKDAVGQSGPIADLDLITWQDRIVSICFDSDTATNPNVLAAREGLAEELYQRGARIVYSINLPELNGEKCGLDDYLSARGVEAFGELDLEELKSPYPRVKLWTGTELLSASIERPAPIVPGWGIRETGKVILTGMGGRGKSTLLLQIACELASGITSPWPCRPCSCWPTTGARLHAGRSSE